MQQFGMSRGRRGREKTAFARWGKRWSFVSSKVPFPIRLRSEKKDTIVPMRWKFRPKPNMATPWMTAEVESNDPAVWLSTRLIVDGSCGRYVFCVSVVGTYSPCHGEYVPTTETQQIALV